MKKDSKKKALEAKKGKFMKEGKKSRAAEEHESDDYKEHKGKGSDNEGCTECGSMKHKTSEH